MLGLRHIILGHATVAFDDNTLITSNQMSLRLLWQPVLALNLLNDNIGQILPFIDIILDHLQERQDIDIYVYRGGTFTICRTCRLAIAQLQEK